MRLKQDGRSGLWAAACLALWAGGAASASAQGAPSGGSPSLEALVRCADMGDKDSRLACYDAAMRAAGYAPKPEVVEAEHKKKFGLSVPFKGKKGEKAPKQAKAPSAPAEPDANSVTVKISQVAVVQPFGRLVIFTEDGQIWEQVDQDVVPPPSAGAQMLIHKEPLGGYFCDVSKYKAIRCKRDR